MTGDLIEKASKQHALEVLGKEQYSNPEMTTAKEAIMEDFKAGIFWYQTNLLLKNEQIKFNKDI